MRIQRIFVDKLFGLFDHDIELHTDEHITILSGPNGFGKTILLRMIAALLQGDFDIFRRVPFERFEVSFDDGRSLKLERTEEANEWNKSWSSGVVFVTPCWGGHAPLELPWGHQALEYAIRRGDKLDGPLLLRAIQATQKGEPRSVSPSVARLLLRAIQATQKGEPRSVSPSVAEEWRLFDHPDTSRHRPEWLQELRDSFNVRLIETQRLDVTDEDPDLRERGHRPTVVRHAEDLAERIQQLLARSASRSQELDRTFPTRLLQKSMTPLSADELRDKLGDLEAKRTRLTELGFLAREQQIDLPSPEAVEDKRDVLSIYVADVEEKLAVFDEMAAKIALLTRIVNELFLYKRMSIDPDKGFVFTAANGHRIEPDDLSSGEQHQLVLLYELLFETARGSLVLIDEPEISLHAAWQERFLDDLKEMVKLSGFDVIVATHSAEIIGAHWDLVAELRGPELPVEATEDTPG